MRARTLLPVLVLALAVAEPLASSAAAQRDHWAERLRAEVEVLSITEPWEGSRGCGRVSADAGVRARVLTVSWGSWEEPEIELLWPACSRTYEDLSSEIVGRRFRVRLRRFIHARELELPPDRQPRWYVWGAPTPID